MTTPSILILGCGSIGKRHARLMRQLGVADLRICDPADDQRAALAAETPPTQSYDNYDTALADRPDIVYICTPPHMHIPQALSALGAGCHVLCEKPLSDSTAAVNDLIAKRDATGLKVMVALCFRHHIGHLLAKRYLDEGRIGRLVNVRAFVGEPILDARPDYPDMYMSKTTGAWDLMHDLDLALWYANQPVTEVRAVSGSYSDMGTPADDVVEIIMRFADRCLGSCHMDFFTRPRARRLDLLGVDGAIAIEFASWEHCTVSLHEKGATAWQHTEFDMVRDDMYRAEDKAFLDAVTQDAPITCTIEEAIKSMQVIEQAQGVPRDA